MVRILQINDREEKIQKIANLYQNVWQSEDNDSIYERFLRHSTYEGYKGLVVVNGYGEIAGFAYGYTSLPGQYYNGLLAKELDSIERKKWLGDCFEFVELAVDSNYRKQGFGRLLVRNLLEGLVHKTAILTTQVHNHSARHFYEGLDWEVVKEPFFPSEKSEPFVIMGKELN
ncbi:Ribosomal protein S18 acetylase RimI [Salinibacillus kushneri]|uniref:Ribosomal protein S18 acetylase RimI n=1 Tax=Salinibacillus kushneri TaxID=237682 RepID=A0A1I0F8P6_9BACI|nr:GNAT family N-acetyltransferase [Salinibacillus kushneri]SET54376.1 Ribosomal protein S18 acetylase RimI [Salinibacillus kushneri]